MKPIRTGLVVAALIFAVGSFLTPAPAQDTVRGWQHGAMAISISPPGLQSAGWELDGEWERTSDKHRVRMTEQQEGQYFGHITELGTRLQAFGFKVGEHTFVLTQTQRNVYEGTVKWRSTGGGVWWSSVTVTVTGPNNFTAGNIGDWVRWKR